MSCYCGVGVQTGVEIELRRVGWRRKEGRERVGGGVVETQVRLEGGAAG